MRILPMAALVSALSISLLAMLGAGRAAVAQTPVPPGAVVETDTGPVRGIVGEDYRLFLGIPYAAPPVGERRWQSPQPVTPWSEVRDATKPASMCAQVAMFGIGPGGGEEDCLYLNVTTPRSSSDAPLKPVMVWVHGGGFTTGAGSIYDARRLAVKGDVVVVTINYRLGIFGFFGYPRLDGSGGFGLEDQQAALRWVQRNAAAFGGDPENVTLFGESAGGMSACAQLTSPSAAGLFHRAIIQSGSCLIDWPENGISFGAPAGDLWFSPEELDPLGAAVASELGCDDTTSAVACLRELPADELLQTSLAQAFGGVGFGNAVLPENPAAALRAGRFHSLPIMSGTTRDEARTFVAFSPEPITGEGFQDLLDTAFGADAAAVAERYPRDAFTSPALAWATAMTDRVWACPALASDELFAAQAPAYAYEFADDQAPPLFAFREDLPGGAYHGAEIAYLFDIAFEGLDPDLTLTLQQQRLSDVMIGYWANFARSGDPNGPGLPRWEPFRKGGEALYVQSLAPGDDGVQRVDFGTEHQCAFWDSLDAEG